MCVHVCEYMCVFLSPLLNNKVSLKLLNSYKCKHSLKL